MARVITFSRFFPSYHPKAGQPTFFVQKILAGLVAPNFVPVTDIGNPPKFHTIRGGNRWNVGDKFSPRIWSGRPYNSKQIIIAPDTEIKKIWKFEITSGNFYIDGKLFHEWQRLSNNDGLPDIDDLCEWFQYKKSGASIPWFEGQIICWNDQIEY